MTAADSPSDYDRWVEMIINGKPKRKPNVEELLTFSTALALLKDGKKLQRSGWNGKGMFVFLVPGSVFKVNRPPLLGIYPEGTEIRYHGHVDMKTADGMVVPWLCSQTDLLADDWQVLA